MAKLWYQIKTNQISKDDAIKLILSKGKDNLQKKTDTMPKNYRAMVNAMIERYNLIPFNEDMKAHYADRIKNKAPDEYAKAVKGIPDAWYTAFASKVFGISTTS